MWAVPLQLSNVYTDSFEALPYHPGCEILCFLRKYLLSYLITWFLLIVPRNVLQDILISIKVITCTDGRSVGLTDSHPKFNTSRHPDRFDEYNIYNNILNIIVYNIVYIYLA